MITAADREELNYLFGDSISDADLLQAVECIESAQSSVDRAPQISTASNVIETTARTESAGNTGGVETVEPFQIGMFLYQLYIYYLYINFTC